MAKKTFSPNEILSLKTYKRLGMLHVCLGEHCAGIGLTESGFTKEQVGMRVQVLPIIGSKTKEPIGAEVTLPSGKKQAWKLLDRRKLTVLHVDPSDTPMTKEQIDAAVRKAEQARADAQPASASSKTPEAPKNAQDARATEPPKPVTAAQQQPARKVG